MLLSCVSCWHEQGYQRHFEVQSLNSLTHAHTHTCLILHHYCHLTLSPRPLLFASISPSHGLSPVTCIDLCLRAEQWFDKRVIVSLSSPGSHSIVSWNSKITAQHSFLTRWWIRLLILECKKKKAEICTLYNNHCKVIRIWPSEDRFLDLKPTFSILKRGSSTSMQHMPAQ